MNNEDVEEIIRSIDIQYEGVRKLAQKVVDEYWTIFKINNRNYMNSGEIEKCGSIAPRLRTYKKPYRHKIIWARFIKTKKNSSRKGWSDKDITPTARGYKEGTFKKAGGHEWEVELIMKYEAQLDLLRFKLDRLYDAKKSLISLIRKESQDDTEN